MDRQQGFSKRKKCEVQDLMESLNLEDLELDLRTEEEYRMFEASFLEESFKEGETGKKLKVTFDFANQEDHADDKDKDLMALASSAGGPMLVEGLEGGDDEDDDAAFLGDSEGFNLDDNVEEIVQGLEDKYELQRDQIVQEDGLVSTPLHALKQLASDFKETLHTEVLILPSNTGGKQLARVELIVGTLRGVGESFGRRMAAQMAALDILLKVPLKDKFKVVPYGLLPGCRINPRVTIDLLRLCKKNKLRPPRYQTGVITTAVGLSPVYEVKCFIGNKVAGTGSSDDPQLSRKLAARNVLEKMTLQIYPLDYVAFGEYCMTFDQLKKCGYKLVMSDIKKRWLLEHCTEEHDANENRGIDAGEMSALVKDIVEKPEEASMQVTVSNMKQAEASGDRKICLR